VSDLRSQDAAKSITVFVDHRLKYLQCSLCLRFCEIDISFAFRINNHLFHEHWINARLKHFVHLLVLNLTLKRITMGDNKNVKDGRDRSKIDSNEDYELSYLQEKLGVSMEQVRDAIEAVGNNRDKVEEYLKKNK